ncbi:hypothetical protein E1B28_010737 [Marasmius oreades]|uniref:Uncharacterized protein n=1 Tax=Marasmius oreades TaxID=181124 RepID=A0A9P7UQH5_9AGAR|nr:uncharacterized protein E1B28_010737 [Marasmius oreades]KAG7089026.1 hypothetical protein E1B28_010737 [Marasmius oreades]
MLYRERRSWTAEEDQLLREAVNREDPGNPTPSKWHAISKHVPNRTNKDCRKRWFAKMASDVVKGGWSPDEDERLVKAIEKYGTRWSMVASLVQTRNSDQCAKRWTDTLNPTIDRTSWTPEQDGLLVNAVNEHGKLWTKIVKTYFPGRTGLSAKNRYNSITRFNRDSSRTRRRPSSVRRKSESVSSCSSSVSPVTPSAPIPDLPGALYNSPQCSNFSIDTSSWSPTFSDSTDESSYKSMACNELFLPKDMSTGAPHGHGHSHTHTHTHTHTHGHSHGHGHVSYPVYDMPPLSQCPTYDIVPDSAASTPYTTSSSHGGSPVPPHQNSNRLSVHLPSLATGGGGRVNRAYGSVSSDHSNSSNGLCQTPSSAAGYSRPGGRPWETGGDPAAIHWEKARQHPLY